MKKVRILSALASLGASALVAASPAFALTVELSGNGDSSDNSANITVNKTTTITQTNTADIKNKVSADANTGYNSANQNTGGDTSIETGDASSSVSVNNTANSSKSSIGCCDNTDLSVSLSANGSGSNNNVRFNWTDQRDIITLNDLNINNYINARANTGGNEANGNTGGDTSIKTGDANVSVMIGNSGNNNFASVCGCLVASVNPPTPAVTPIPGLTPGIPAVLGVSKTLPMTGFDYPYHLIFAGTLSLVGAGLFLRRKTSEIEQALTSLTSKLNLG